jgi:oligopeptide/dipeptide ABC transporter ATP-binding protein
MACLLITHDLGVVAEFCDRAAVMYAGRIVETGPADAVFARPRHRYTAALVRTMPAINPPGALLPAIPGQVPAPGQRGAACSFAPRCDGAVGGCDVRPGLVDGVACWNPAG